MAVPHCNKMGCQELCSIKVSGPGAKNPNQEYYACPNHGFAFFKAIGNRGATQYNSSAQFVNPAPPPNTLLSSSSAVAPLLSVSLEGRLVAAESNISLLNQKMMQMDAAVNQLMMMFKPSQDMLTQPPQ